MKKKAFTLIELLVAITIVVILSAIGFISYSGFTTTARDTQRTSNIGLLKSALKNYKQERGVYPIPGDYLTLTNSGEEVAYQGKLNKGVPLNNIDNLPSDPSNQLYYPYSIKSNRSEMQIYATLEGDESTGVITLLDGDYKTVSKNVLPSIMIANYGSGFTVEIHDGIGIGSDNRELFIFDKSINNLVYTHDGGFASYSDGTIFDTLLSNAELTGTFWQNNDFRSCLEIEEAGKAISGSGVTEEYQIVDSNGNISNTNCTF